MSEVNANCNGNVRSANLQFSRNGRWGTCASCPRDSDGKVYPESCENTKRYDHNLDFDGLVEYRGGARVT